MAESDNTRSPPAIEQNLIGQKSTKNAIFDDVSEHSREENQEVLPETVSDSLVNDLDQSRRSMERTLVFCLSPTKALANTVMTKLMTTRYDDHNSIRDHIMQMIDITNQLKSIDMEISYGFLVLFILNHLNEIQIICVQEEEKLNQNKLEISHLAETSSDRKGTFRASENKGYVTHANFQLNETTQIQKQNHRKERKCFFCRKKGHLKRDCLKYNKWLENKGAINSQKTHLDLSKHIEIKYLVVREKLRALVVSIEHISRKLMIVVTLTKCLSLKWFVEHVAHMNLINM
ncbi:hypothetical protein AMTRI_Chr11g101580 [Amborella trichopoda]